MPCHFICVFYVTAFNLFRLMFTFGDLERCTERHHGEWGSCSCTLNHRKDAVHNYDIHSVAVQKRNTSIKVQLYMDTRYVPSRCSISFNFSIHGLHFQPTFIFILCVDNTQPLVNSTSPYRHLAVSCVVIILTRCPPNSMNAYKHHPIVRMHKIKHKNIKSFENSNKIHLSFLELVVALLCVFCFV